MSLTLAQARTKVRVRTRHVGDIVRLTDTILDVILNDEYRQLRTELQTLAPTAYLCTTANLTLTAAGDTLGLTHAGVTFERIYRVEKLNDVQEWDPLDRADAFAPRDHALGCSTVYPLWEKRNTCIVLHPEGECTGTYRILYYRTPTNLSAATHAFQLPEPLFNVLIARACAQVAENDGNDGTPFTKRADKLLESVSSILWQEYGATPNLVGLRSVLGY